MNIINAQVNTVELGVIEQGFVRFEMGKILQVGKMGNFEQDSEETLDAKGGLVLPGFVDAHCHLGLCGDSLRQEGEDCNEATEPITPQVRAIDAINMQDRCFKEARKFGVTTVVVSPGSANPIGGQIACLKTFGKTVEEALISSNIGTKFAMGENPKMCYSEKNILPSTRMGTAAVIREELTKAKRYLEDCENEKDSSKFDFKYESLRALLTRESKAHIHAHRADDISTAIRIAHEFELDYILIHATGAREVLEQLIAEDVKIVTGPILCDRNKPELKDLEPIVPGILSNLGLKMALCTDHPVIPIQYLALCAMLAIKNGQSKESALRAITLDAAKICGVSDRVGSIREGKDADLLLFKKDPLVWAFEEPSHVFINGKRVV